jgi:hypothetical protein
MQHSNACKPHTCHLGLELWPLLLHLPWQAVAVLDGQRLAYCPCHLSAMQALCCPCLQDAATAFQKQQQQQRQADMPCHHGHEHADGWFKTAMYATVLARTCYRRHSNPPVSAISAVARVVPATATIPVAPVFARHRRRRYREYKIAFRKPLTTPTVT